MRRTLAVLALASFLADGRGAAAHAMLRGSQPAVGSTVQAAPSRVEISFSEAVEPRFSTIEVTDATGSSVGQGAATRGSDGKILALGLQRIGPGTYHVVWHATSVDTHRTEGSFSFTVAP